MVLFVKKDIVLHSGAKSDFKIEADSLTDEDIDTLAYLISKKFRFNGVVGVAKGGIRLGKALRQYREDDVGLPILLVDDVLTTGKSMVEWLDKIGGGLSVIGVVIFARGQCPSWIHPIFQMWN
jgi:hypothetical protein